MMIKHWPKLDPPMRYVKKQRASQHKSDMLCSVQHSITFVVSISVYVRANMPPSRPFNITSSSFPNEKNRQSLWQSKTSRGRTEHTHQDPSRLVMIKTVNQQTSDIAYTTVPRTLMTGSKFKGLCWCHILGSCQRCVKTTNLVRDWHNFIIYKYRICILLTRHSDVYPSHKRHQTNYDPPP